MNETGNTGYISAETVPPVGGMVERVARALCLRSGCDPDYKFEDDSRPMWTDWSLDARAAIEAMQEPSSKMCAAACNALKKHIDSFSEEQRLGRWPGRQDDGGWRVPNKEKHAVRYRAMIDAALKEPA